ncbi:unnamed protein product [Mytilus coruscus]|uniref:HTH psq-type domain-containing protein n=1 Tax=Mytilus coruscus TaxID=42192 RepID=A0A6J8B4F8_MYTCO|nr:unnamed protein product [Mytilus coruscus]
MARKVKGLYQKQSPMLQRAIEAVRSNQMSIRKAADHYGVKKSTLGDHVSGKIATGRKSGRSTVFELDVEKQIVAKAQLVSQQGFGVSRKQLMRKAGQLARTMKLKTPFKKGIPGQAWWDGFRQRNPELVLRKPEKLASTRARNLNKPVVDNYFKDLDNTLTELNLRDSPNAIWNMDETNSNMEHTPAKKCSRKGVKSVPGLVSNSRESVTVVACISAAGIAMPPMNVVKGKTEKSLNGFNRSEGPENAVWAFQKNAWIDDAGCLKWFHEVFLQNCGPKRPQLLIVDQHRSHEALDLLEEGLHACEPTNIEFPEPEINREITTTETRPEEEQHDIDPNPTKNSTTDLLPYDGVNPEINLELLSQIAVENQDSILDEKEREEVEEIFNLSVLIGKSTEPEIIDLPLTLPPDNSGDNIRHNLLQDHTVEPIQHGAIQQRRDDPLWSSTMMQSPLKVVDWNSEINNIFTVASHASINEKPQKRKKKQTGHRILTSDECVVEKRLQKQKKEENDTKKKVNAENRKKKAIDVFIKKMK